MKRRAFVLASAALAVAPDLYARMARVALVLGGGGCRGYGHLGVLRVLEAEGIRPDLIVGSSAGSLVGGLYAAGVKAAELESIGERMNPNLLRDWIFPRLGVFGGAGIARFVRGRVGEREVGQLSTRFAAVATDLRSGEAVVLDRGELGEVVQASSSAPGLLEPVRLNDRLLVDGNLVAPVPVRAARQLGARHVIAVDVSFPPEHADLSDPFDALYQGFSILTRHLALAERAEADVLVAPDLPRHDDMRPATLKSLVDAGAAAARAALPAIRRLVAAGGR